jgi:hypothetical protein
MLSPGPIFNVHAERDEMMSLDRAPLGGRRIIGIRGGRVEGPKRKGRILPGGADWQMDLRTC